MQVFNKTKTARGFGHIGFVDHYGKQCSIQKSSLAIEDAIWIGIDNPELKFLAPHGVGWVDYPLHDSVSCVTRMHLTQEQVKGIITILQKFVDTGEI